MRQVLTDSMYNENDISYESPFGSARNSDTSQWQKQTKKLSTKHPLVDGIKRGFKVQLKGHIVAITNVDEIFNTGPSSNRFGTKHPFVKGAHF